jgi:hypothetical protein
VQRGGTEGYFGLRCIDLAVFAIFPVVNVYLQIQVWNLMDKPEDYWVRNNDERYTKWLRLLEFMWIHSISNHQSARSSKHISKNSVIYSSVILKWELAEEIIPHLKLWGKLPPWSRKSSTLVDILLKLAIMNLPNRL